MAERSTPGRWGPFPVRAPIGKLAGIILSLALVPVWWKVGAWKRPVLEQLYLKTYARTAVGSMSLHAKRPVPNKQYALLVKGSTSSPILATDRDLNRAAPVWMQLVPAYPPALHAWLEKEIYGGDILNTFRLFILLSCGGFVLCVWLGVEIDRRRQRAGQYGVHVRGTRFVSRRLFNRLAPKSKPGIVLRCGKRTWQTIRIAEELLAYHFAIFGATGRGKSTLIREILKQAQARGETAVIYDPKDEFRDEFYSGDRGDIIFDPTDQRCPYWEMEGEAPDEAQAAPWASAFYPEIPRSQPFFRDYAKGMFTFLQSRFSAFNEPDNPATAATLGYWLAHPKDEVAPRLKGTEFAVAADSTAKEQSAGLYATLGQVSRALRMLPASPEGLRKFSVREWSKKRKGWIFFTSTALTAEALLPIQSAMLDVLILSTQTPAQDGAALPKVWFVLDEVASLQKLPQLESGMTKQRASGGTLILGIHDQAQLVKRYGEEGARTVMGQAATNIILGVEDGNSAKACELMIGREEIERMTENRPVHMDAKHRSRSWSNQTVESPVVMASEIQALPRFHGYLKQEGKIVKVEIQKLPRTIRTSRIERLIPRLSFREEPEANPVAETVAPVRREAVAVPVDDEPPEPYRKPTSRAKATTNPFVAS